MSNEHMAQCELCVQNFKKKKKRKGKQIKTDKKKKEDKLKTVSREREKGNIFFSLLSKIYGDRVVGFHRSKR